MSNNAFFGFAHPLFGLGFPHPGQKTTVWEIRLQQAEQRTRDIIVSSNSRYALNYKTGKYAHVSCDERHLHSSRISNFLLAHAAHMLAYRKSGEQRIFYRQKSLKPPTFYK
jgi:hypothetical protein